MTSGTISQTGGRRRGVIIIAAAVLVLSLGGAAARAGMFEGGEQPEHAAGPQEMPPMPVDVDTAATRPPSPSSAVTLCDASMRMPRSR